MDKRGRGGGRETHTSDDDGWLKEDNVLVVIFPDG